MDTEIIARRQLTWAQIADWGSLIKIRQTALLLVTAISAYTLTCGLPFDPYEGVGMTIGLFLAISGCTVLNMLLDRDVDAQMARTADRPLAAGRIPPRAAGVLGGALSWAGLLLSFALCCSSIIAPFLFTFYNYSFQRVKSYPYPTITLNGIANLQKCHIVLVLASWADYSHFTPSSPKNDKNIFLFCLYICLLYTSPSPRDLSTSRMPSSA